MPLRLDLAHDWSLIAAAAAAFLSFIMLFAPWATGFGQSLNAFDDAMQAAGPALIIVAAFAVIILMACALMFPDRRFRCLAFSLIPASNLLVIYIIKLSDVSDLIDIWGVSGGVSLGAGIWLGFVFALATDAFLVWALVELRKVRITGPQSPG